MREQYYSAKRNHHGLVAILVVLCLFGCQDAETSDESTKVATIESVVGSEELERSRTILFFGNSITAGYRMNPNDAFPALIQEKLDSLGYTSYQVSNSGISGETSGDGLARIRWTLKQPIDIFFLELGGNDGLRGMSLGETKENLSNILEEVKKAYPHSKLMVAGMEIPPNMGPEYSQEFRELFPYLAETFDAVLIPFLLNNVAAEPELNLDDGIHPNEEGHQIVANTVWKFLEPLLLNDSSS